MSTQYVEGEEEQLQRLEPLVHQAVREFALLSRRPVPDRVAELLRWMVREAFRAGHSHAHSRNTVKEDLWPTEEVTK